MLLILVRHRNNIVRMLAGKEPRIGRKPRDLDPPRDSEEPRD